MELLVVVPGIQGSVLTFNDERVWPPSVLEAIFGYPEDKFDLLREDHLEPTALIDSVGPVSFYESLLEDVGRCGFSKNSDHWRRSNIDTAHCLAQALDEAWEDTYQQIESITLLAHSMGGLVCRFLIESGRYDDRPWFSQLSKLITLGTPHSGAPKALWMLNGKERQSGLSPEQVKELASDPRFPSVYELVGPESAPFTWQPEQHTQPPRVMSPFSEEIAQGLDLVDTNISIAKSFWSHLDAGNKPDFIDYLTLVGTSLETIVRNSWAGGTQGLLPIERRDGGDGTVPSFSAVLPNVPQVYSRKSHVRVFEDRGFRRLLYQVLGAPTGVLPYSVGDEIAPDEATRVALSIGQDSYQSGSPIQFLVSYDRPQQDPNAIIAIYKYSPENESIDDSVAMDKVTATLHGVTAQEWSFTAEVNLGPGMYVAQLDGVSDDPTQNAFVIYPA